MGLSREGNTVQPKVIWFGFRLIGNSVWTKLPPKCCNEIKKKSAYKVKHNKVG